MKAANQRFPFGLEIRPVCAVLRFGATHYHADSFSALQEALGEAAKSAPGARVVVDLSGVVLLSSTALRALRAAHLALEARGGRLVAAGGGELVASVLKFAPFILRYAGVDEAVAALAAAGGEGTGS